MTFRHIYKLNAALVLAAAGTANWASIVRAGIATPSKPVLRMRVVFKYLSFSLG